MQNFAGAIDVPLRTRLLVYVDSVDELPHAADDVTVAGRDDLPGARNAVDVSAQRQRKERSDIFRRNAGNCLVIQTLHAYGGRPTHIAARAGIGLRAPREGQAPRSEERRVGKEG